MTQWRGRCALCPSAHCDVLLSTHELLCSAISQCFVAMALLLSTWDGFGTCGRWPQEMILVLSSFFSLSSCYLGQDPGPWDATLVGYISSSDKPAWKHPHRHRHDYGCLLVNSEFSQIDHQGNPQQPPGWIWQAYNQVPLTKPMLVSSLPTTAQILGA